MDFCPPPLPPWKYAVVCQCLFPHCTWHASFRVCPSPPRKILNWLRMAWNGEKSKKKKLPLGDPHPKKTWKNFDYNWNFFFRDFQFSRRFRWFWTTFKKILKKILEIFLSFFSGGGVTKGKIFFFDFLPFQAILSQFFGIQCCGAGTENSKIILAPAPQPAICP